MFFSTVRTASWFFFDVNPTMTHTEFTGTRLNI